MAAPQQPTERQQPATGEGEVMKDKIHAVTIDGTTYLAKGKTMKGAVASVIDHLTGGMRQRAAVELATGEQLYNAGRDGASVIGDDSLSGSAEGQQIPLIGAAERTGEPA